MAQTIQHYQSRQNALKAELKKSYDTDSFILEFSEVGYVTCSFQDDTNKSSKFEEGIKLAFDSIKNSLSCKADTKKDIDGRHNYNPDFHITRVIRALQVNCDKPLPADIAIVKSFYTSYKAAREIRKVQTKDQKLKDFIITLAEFKAEAIKILRTYPFWPSIPNNPSHLTDDDYCMQAITFWSENHVFMHLSGAYLFYHYLKDTVKIPETELCEVKYLKRVGIEKITKLLRLYLEAHCNTGGEFAYIYELNSVTYSKYTIYVMMNLFDFAPDQDIKDHARRILDTYVKHLLALADCTYGLNCLAVAGRGYDKNQYQKITGFDITMWMRLLTGIYNTGANRLSGDISNDQVQYKATYITDALIFTQYMPPSNYYDAFTTKSIVSMKISPTFDELETFYDSRLQNYGLTSYDILPLKWSAGLLLHPRLMRESIRFMHDHLMLQHKDLTMHFWLYLLYFNLSNNDVWKRGPTAVANWCKQEGTELLHSILDFMKLKDKPGTYILFCLIVGGILFAPILVIDVAIGGAVGGYEVGKFALSTPVDWTKFVTALPALTALLIDALKQSLETLVGDLSQLVKGQSYLGLKLNVFKDANFAMSSLDQFNVGRCGWQQVPWMINFDGIPVFSRSGLGTLAGEEQMTNFNQPCVRQANDIMMITHVAKNKNLYMTSDAQIKVHLFWPFGHFAKYKDDKSIDKTRQFKVRMATKDKTFKHDDVKTYDDFSYDGSCKNVWRIAESDLSYIAVLTTSDLARVKRSKANFPFGDEAKVKRDTKGEIFFDHFETLVKTLWKDIVADPVEAIVHDPLDAAKEVAEYVKTEVNEVVHDVATGVKVVEQGVTTVAKATGVVAAGALHLAGDVIDAEKEIISGKDPVKVGKDLIKDGLDVVKDTKKTVRKLFRGNKKRNNKVHPVGEIVEEIEEHIVEPCTEVLEDYLDAIKNQDDGVGTLRSRTLVLEAYYTTHDHVTFIAVVGTKKEFASVKDFVKRKLNNISVTEDHRAKTVTLHVNGEPQFINPTELSDDSGELGKVTKKFFDDASGHMFFF